MAKGKRRVASNKKSAANKASNVERFDTREEEPDEDSDSYYQDDVDQFHASRDQILLDSGAKLPSGDISSGEDEVLAFDDDDDDDDDEQYQVMKKRLHQIRSLGHHQAMASDLEDSGEEDEGKATKGDKGEKSWGSSRSKFYGGHDSDLDEDLSGSEPEAAALEEQEALAVQKRLLMAMDEEDIGLDMFKQTPQTEEKPTEKISKDLSKMSKKEKLKLLKKQSPELLDLIQDFKSRTVELRQKLLPIVGLIRNNKLSSKSSGAKLVETKTSLCMNYLVNVSFYLSLKAKQTPVENHPIIKRLVQYRNLLKQMDEVEPRCRSEMDAILERIANGDEFQTIEDEELEPKFKSGLLEKKSKKVSKKEMSKKRLSEMMDSLDSDEEEAMTQESDPSHGGRSWGRKKSRLDGPDDTDMSINPEGADADEVGGPDDEDVMEEGEAERRGINYQIEKNKGLTTKKRKELRNPRVKHKLKYKKAKIRRKGQVREVRKEVDRYGGEISGIRAGIKRSIKLK